MASKVKLKLPASIWTEKDTKVLASNTLATIKRRTSKGLSSNGGKFKDYSTKSMYVSFKGARLKPKGGRLSRTGNSVFMLEAMSNTNMTLVREAVQQLRGKAQK